MAPNERRQGPEVGRGPVSEEVEVEGPGDAGADPDPVQGALSGPVLRFARRVFALPEAA